MGTARDVIGGTSSRKALRARRRDEQRERDLVLRHRWYAGGIATLLSAALVFTGMTPAVADDVPAPVDTLSSQEQTDEQKAAEEAAAKAAEEAAAAAKAAEEEAAKKAAEEEAAAKAAEEEAAKKAAEEQATQEQKQDADESGDAGADGGDLDGIIMPMLVGPEVITGPYIYWEARSTAAGNPLIGGATFEIQGPRTGGGGGGTWNNNVAIVEDNTGQAGYTGADLDPDPGEFQVQTIGTHTVVTTSRYRVQKYAAPAGYALGTAPWVEQGTNAWSNDVWDAGDFTFAAIATRSHTINVNKGDLRTGLAGDTNVNISSTYTVGTRFGLYTSDVSSTPIATCEITLAGNPCTFTGVNASGVLWVGELDPVPGSPAALNYSAGLGTLTTGTTSGFTNRPYRYATSSLSSWMNETVTVPSSPTTENEWDESSGRFMNRLNNPQLSLTCQAGIDIALVIDLSASVFPARNTLRDAAKGFVASLLGTGSQVALISFGNLSPRANTSNVPLTLVDAAGQTTLNNTIDTYWNAVNQTGQSGQGTNWDAGLWAASAAAESYDLVIVLTDGNPTYSATNNNGTSQGSGSGSLTTFRELERAVASANVIKNKGARLITVGIGAAGAVSNHNLASISGPTGWAVGDTSLNDFDYINAEWSALSQLLEDFASAINCEANVQVTKMTQVGDAAPVAASGWDFTLAKTGDGSISGNATQTTGATGEADWTVGFTQPNQSVSSVTLTETVLPGWTLSGATCTVNGATVVPAVDSAAGTVALSNISVGIGGNVDCVVINTPQPTSLTITKAFENQYGAPAVPGDWTLTATNGGTTTNFTSGVTQVVTPGTYTIGEVLQDGYELVGITCTAADGVTFNPATNAVTIAQGKAASCTVTNRDKPAELTVIKKDMGETVLPGARFQLWNDVDGSQTLDPAVDTKVGGTQSAGTYTWTGLPWGAYLVEEVTPPVGYDLADPTVQAVTLGAAETSTAAVLTFHNPRSAGTLTIEKVVDDPNGGYTGGTTKTFSGTYACGEGYSGDFSTLTTDTDVVITGIPAGRECVVTETQPTGGLLNGSFSWGTPSVAPAQVTIVNGGNVTVTITNPVVQSFGALTVTKQLSETPSDFSGTFSGGWSCTLANGPTTSGTWSVTFTNGVAAPTVYTGPVTQIPLTSLCSVTETAPSNGLFTDPSYTWASSDVSPATAVQLTTLQQTASFTVTNTAQRSSLELQKIVSNTNGGTAVNTDWDGKLQAQRGDDSVLTYNHDELKYVAPGTYTLSELAGPAGYTWTGLQCSVDGGTFSNVFDGKTVTVPGGGAVVCQFTNRDVAPELTLVKNVDNQNGVGSANASAWTLSATTTGGPNVSGNGAPATGTTASITGPVKGQSVYTLAESGGPSGYTEGAWACYITGTRTAYPLTTDGTLIPVVGTDVTCEITNTAIPATGTVVKDEKSTQQLADGTWQIVYDVTVTNNSSTSTFFYTLTDQLQFGAGITPTAASWAGATSGTFTPPLTGQQTLNGSGSLAPSASATYTVTVIATVSDAAADAATSVCTSTAPQRAFRNTATMTAGGTPTTVEDCSQPWFPTIEKTAGTPTQNADASWNVSYTVTVANPNAGALGAVKLEDSFPAAPAGWSYSPNSWAVAAVDAAPAPISPTYAPGTTGTIYEGGLAANTSYTYTVSAKLVPGSLATPLGVCAADGGLRNTATVTSGLVVSDATACVDVALPPVTVTKTTSNAQVQQLEGGNWQIDYTIVVQNTSTTLTTVYTLTDLPQLGTGFSVVSATWLDPAPVANTPIGLQGTPEGTHTYRFRIVASFDPTVQNPELTCSPQETGAFSNQVTVTFPGDSASDRACAQPGTPTVAKTAPAVATQVSATQWTLSYTVTVSNTSGQTLAYTATDTPADLPTGVTGAGWTASGPVITVGGSGATTAGWNGTAGATELATGVIPNGATHVYTVSQTVTVADSVDPETLVCSENAPTNGFWNEASVTNGIGGNSDDACTGIVLPTVSIVKSDATVAQNADQQWLLSYDITVTNDSDTLEAAYSLTDTPQFGTNFDVVTGSGYWTAQGDDTPLSGDPSGSLAAGGSATFTYHVTATTADGFNPDTALRCTTTGENPGGGFYNVATVTFPGGSDSDAGCGVPQAPVVTKSAPATAQQVDGAWLLSYTVTVTNGSGIPLAYSLTDTPAALPANVDLTTAWAISGPATRHDGDAYTAAVPAWDGGDNTAVGSGLLPAGTSHVFTVTATVTLQDDVVPSDLVCNPTTGTGFWNTASVTNGVGGNDSTACTGITPPTLSIDKSDATVSQGEDGVWSLSYEVTITNGTDLSSPYTITDTPQFASLFTIVPDSASWTGPGTVSPQPTGTIAANSQLVFTYSVQATADAPDATEAELDAALSCTEGGDEPGGGFYNVATVTFPGGSDSDPGCGEPATPTVTKTAADAIYAGAGVWDLSYTVTVSNGSDITLGYEASDTAAALPAGVSLAPGASWAVTGPADLDGGTATPVDPAWSGSGLFATGSLPAGASHVYTVTAQVVFAEDIDTAVLVCSEVPGGSGVWNTATVTNGLGSQDDSDCTPFTFAPVSVEKTTSSVQQLTDGDWQIDYTITVTNDGEVPAPYTLTDTPKPDTSFEIVSAGWVDPAPGDEVVQVGTPDVWHYTVVVRAKTGDAFNEQTATTCTTAQDGQSGSGGFYNTVTVSYVGGTDSDDACGVPIKPSVVKTGDAVQNPETGDWTVTYTITVLNEDPADIALAYTLSDIAAAIPSGAEQVGGWTVGTATITDGTASDTASAVDAWAGSGTLGSGFITPGAQHTYTVAATYRILATATPGALTCNENGTGGFRNDATVTNGIGESTDDACVTIEVPGVGISKTVTSTQLEADGRWRITYDVVVTGDAELTTTYSLSDTLTFGGDISVDTASSGWTGQTSGSFGGSTTAQLATNLPIAAGATHTYVVTAYATIDQEAFEGDTLSCQGGNTPGAGGFLNVATVTAGGTTTSAHDCSEPDFPQIDKQAQSVAQVAGEPDQYDVTYLLTVTGGDVAGYYDLADTPAFADGLDILAGTAVQLTPTAGAPIDIDPGVVFAEDVAIAAGAVHTWSVTWRIERTAEFDPADLVCTGEPGSGLFNTAVLDFGGVEQTDDDCIPLIDRVYPTVSKTATSVSQDPTTGEWTITYNVVAALASNPQSLSARYDLTDTLEFGDGITVNAASWVRQGTATGGSFNLTTGTATLASGVVIASGATHTYTVTVRAAVTAEAVEEETLTCESGQGGPEAGGFLNTALLTSGDQTREAFDCAEPQLPTVAKTAAGTTDNADGSQRVSYLVTVTAPAPVAGDPVSNLGYSLTDAPAALPAGAELVGTWHAEAVAPAGLTIDEPTWNGVGEWNVVTGAQFTAAERAAGTVTHTYRIWADIEVTEAPGEFEPCGEGDTGIPVWNSVTLSIGDHTADDDACGSVDWDEVTILKTSELPDGQTEVQPGDVFDYVLTVTNQGTRTATGVHVVDSDLNDRLTILGLTVSGGVTWGPIPGYIGNVVDLTIASLAVGQSVDIRITVEFEPAPTVVEDGESEPAQPIDELHNTACVDSDQDQTVDCDQNTITTRDLTATVWTTCVDDAALLGWTVVKSAALASVPMQMLWTPNSGTPSTVPADVSMQVPASQTTWSDLINWPGEAFTPSGVAIDFPGWRPLQASDYAPGGGFYVPGTSTVMTPAQEAEYLFNGLILDPSELDYAWRGATTVTFSAGTELSFEVEYPAVTPECAVARHAEVEIEKTASVQRAMPGDPFSYTIDVHNVSDDSAADGVIVTDAIPSTIKVTDVTWPGKGDDSVFPNWKTCSVAGQNAAGFGGTLTCELFGPLQPAGREGSTAPLITLKSQVSTTAPAGVITNVAVVDYHTFGDPDDPGRDVDDAVILVSLLPATGGSTPIWALWAAMLGIASGTGLLLGIARRRREAGTR